MPLDVLIVDDSSAIRKVLRQMLPSLGLMGQLSSLPKADTRLVSAAVVPDYLGDYHIVRETGPPGWLRVTIGTPDEMAAFRCALTGVLAAGGGR